MTRTYGPYGLIYQDFPWWYRPRSIDDKLQGGVWRQYAPIPDAQALAMRPFIDSLAARDCLLYSWVVSPRLDFASDLIRAWRFRHATKAFTWIKESVGLRKRWGYYSWPQTEDVWVARRGRGLGAPAVRFDQVLYAPCGRPHEKPAAIRDRLSAMYPNVRKIELFARHRVPGWDAWGNQVGILDRPSGEEERSDARCS